ncbi:ABC transporter permease [Pareuzebyella sediminis]|uniref:ABC transporter permease n=1 Tax=Pareuzebyella sediminis TaxID=2607998 RepID=UPI0011ED2DA4|nr:ABC transporter permease [Pareuzebyella sediminis]
MFKNYIKIAWRNILRNKGIFSINITGLALGIASCLMIMLFVVDELSYDRYNEKADEIVRVVFKAKIEGEDVREAVVMPPVAETLKRQFPEVEQATRLRRMGEPNIIVDNTTFQNSKYAWVDPNFFEVFTLPIIEGERADPLREPFTMVLTKKEAERYFGSIEGAIGKQLRLNEERQPYEVTAVIDEVPQNSHFHFKGFVSMEGHELAHSGTWMNSDFNTYLVLRKGYDHKQLEAKLPEVLKQNMGPQLQEELGVSYAEFNQENSLGLYLQPLTDIHLNPEFSKASTIEEGGDIKYVYIFSAVALFMLLIACINFMNLSTAAASKRAKEVGIRKVLGSNKQQLIKQFLAESAIATVIAMLIATVLLSVSLPFFNSLSGKELALGQLLKPSVLGALFVATVFISLLAGGYPAFFLSSFKPISALKSKFLGFGKSKGIRSGLVVFQFVISAGLILAVLVVNQQMDYIQHKNLGYDKDQILVLRDSYLLCNDNEVLKNELLKDPKVAGVAQSSFVPAGPSDNAVYGIYKDGKFKRRSALYNVDENYLPVMGMQLVEGRNFSDAFGSEEGKTIINQSAAKAFGLGENPVGKTFERASDPENQKLTVIGVVKDFHHESLHRAIEPLIMVYGSSGGLIVRAKTGAMAGLIADARNLWNGFHTDEIFNYTLLNESYRQTYVSEQKMGTVLNVFALLTILVACLGLFGLVTFTAEQRFKEIGIRKVLGSSVPQIMGMLSKDFLKLVGLSFLVAFPLGYYLMDKWLQGFAYRIEIQGWLLALAALVTLCIAFLTIGWKSYRAATMNPVKALRDE